MNEDKPLCECHGEPMWWHKDSQSKRGGYWRCIVKRLENKRRFYKANREKWVESNRLRREKTKSLGLCSHCRVREPEPLMAKCIRCQRYAAEYGFLGYSTIPLAKGSEG